MSLTLKPLSLALLLALSLYAPVSAQTSLNPLDGSLHPHELKRAHVYQEWLNMRSLRAQLNTPLDPRLHAQAKSTEELPGDFNIKEIDVKLSVADHSLPQEATFEVTLEARTEGLRTLTHFSLAEPSRVWRVNANGDEVDMPFEYLEDRAQLTITAPPLRRGVPFSFLISTPLIYPEEDTLGWGEGRGFSYFTGHYLLPQSYGYVRNDLFRVNVEVDVLSEGVFPNTSGAITERGEARSGLGRWRFEGERPTYALSFTLTDRPFTQHDALIDMTAPASSGGSAEGVLGVMASEILSSLRAMIAPLNLQRFTLTTLTDEAGVLIAPLAMIMAPEAWWGVSPLSDPALFSLFEEVFAHEVAHQYFPHLLLLEISAPNWLSEAFAEYFSILYMRDRYESRRLLNANHQSYMRYEYSGDGVEPSVVSEQVYTLPFDEYFLVLYHRGSSILHQLSQRFENFEGSLRSYVEAHRGRLITLDDFLAALNDATPRGDRPPFDLQAYLERVLFGNERLNVEVTARYLSDDQSMLELTRRPIDDALEVSLLASSAEGATQVPFYLPLSEPIRFDHSAQAIHLDPHLEHFLRARSVEPADVDLNGVVDGLDVLDILSRAPLRLNDPTNLNRPGGHLYERRFDINDDEFIDELDFNIVIGRFGGVTR